MFGKSTPLPNKRLERIFLELRDEKRIFDENIKLRENSGTPNFQGLNYLGIYKVLNYNPTFFKECLLQYNDDIIRFILLHEIGHILDPESTRIENVLVKYFIIASIAAICITLVIGSGIVGFVITVLFTISLCFLLFREIRSKINSMTNDEFTADAFAFRNFQEHYHPADPCAFIEEFFKAMDSMTADPTYQKILNDIVGGPIKGKIIKWAGVEKGYHPSEEERMRRLKIIAKCK